jgi:phosphatidylglycerophosphatase A
MTPTMNDRSAVLPAAGRKTLWAWAVGTFFGVGLFKPGPGTWGSVAAVLLWMCGVLFLRPHFDFELSEYGFAVFFLAVVTFVAVICAIVIGIPAATRVARQSGREDPGYVVIDEVAGQWLMLVVCRHDWPHALLALALFRLFDITKPWPIRKLEALPGGWGIMLDDLAAGFFGLIVLLVIQHWW